MTLDEILHKIDDLSSEERQILRREVANRLSKAEAQSATPETGATLKEDRQKDEA